MPRFADLHLHTVHSDGTRSPKEVVDVARESGLGIIAISDHDNLAACREIAPYAAERGLMLIPAIELSCIHRGSDVHILAYAVDLDDPRVERCLTEFRATRDRRGDAMVERLIALGYSISIERVREIAGEGALGRPHVARALIEIGAVSSIQEAFDRFLGPGCPAYVDKQRFDVSEAVELVHSSGGLTSVAHPTLYEDHQLIVPELLDAGVDGIEVLHPEVSESARDYYTRLATDRGRMLTGGSDDHGLPGRTSLGTIRTPEEWIGAILERV
jgi:3',5'-nucleoside bisphosphate phosphatase